jgi:hypothetical protein
VEATAKATSSTAEDAMTDAFESEVQKFVARQNGGEMTPRTVYGMLVAVDTDAQARSAEMDAKLTDHIEDDRKQLSRIASHLESEAGNLRRALNDAMDTHASGCVLRREPRRKGDPPDVEYPATKPAMFTREALVANFWVLVGLLVLSGVVNALLDLVFKR